MLKSKLFVLTIIGLCCSILTFFALNRFDASAFHLIRKSLINYGHFPAFILFYYLVYSSLNLFAYFKGNQKSSYLSLAICFAIVLLVEIIQPFFGRSFGIDDILVGLLSSSLAFYLHRSYQQSNLTLSTINITQFKALLLTLRKPLCLILITGIALFIPVLQNTYLLFDQQKQFPTLYDTNQVQLAEHWYSSPNQGIFGDTSKITRETCPGIQYTSVENTKEDTSIEKQTCIKVMPALTPWSGAYYHNGLSDWNERYKELYIQLYSNSNTSMLIKIEDRSKAYFNYNDRINIHLDIQKGYQEIKVDISSIHHPLESGRMIESNNIKGLLISVPYGSDAFYLYQVKLK